MSALAKLRVGIVAAGVSCLVIGYAWAQQQTETAREIGSEQARDDIRAAQPGQAGQIDRAQTERREYTAEFRGTQAASGGANKQVEQYLTACLLAKNQAEIELAQFAQQQSQNPEVKDFAQMLVKDHQQIVQQLQQLKQGQSGTTRQDQSFGATRGLETEGQTADTTRLPGSPGAGQPTSPADPARTQVTPGLSQEASQALTAGGLRPGQQAQQDAAIQQLIELDRQIVERHSQALREELQQKQGAEFDQAFVGSQVAGHMHMLTALEVISQQGPERLQQLAKQAEPSVQQHLDHAKQLKEQLSQNGQPGASQAERPQRDRTRTPR